MVVIPQRVKVLEFSLRLSIDSLEIPFMNYSNDSSLSKFKIGAFSLYSKSGTATSLSGNGITCAFPISSQLKRKKVKNNKLKART
jgi:hypothetical protein